MNQSYKDKTFLGRFPASTLNVGLSPWENMKPHCLHINALICDSGMELEYLTIAAELLNITLNFKHTNVPGCGSLDSSGNWTGLIGMLYNREIDITGNLCTIDSTRKEVKWLRHTWPVLQYKQSFLIKAPEPSFFFSMWGPFDFNVWMCVIATLLLFVIHVIFSEILVYGKPFTNAVVNSMMNTIQVTSGMNGPSVNFQWFLWCCIAGYITLSYSTFITSALLKPVTVERPFVNNEQLAEAMLKGQYKLLTYQKPANIPKYLNEETAYKLHRALERHSYHYFQRRSSKGDNNHLMLNELLQHDNLVVVQGRFLLKIYMDRFLHRRKLWLIFDETSPFIWSCYFYRSGFPLANALDKALILMGDFKDYLKNIYFRLSKGVIETNYIKGEVQTTLVITMKIVQGPLICYGVGIIASFALFLIERLYPPTDLRSRTRSLSIRRQIISNF